MLNLRWNGCSGFAPSATTRTRGTAKQYAAQIEQLRTMFQPFNPKPPPTLCKGVQFHRRLHGLGRRLRRQPQLALRTDYSSKSGAVVLEGFTTNDPVRAVVAFDAPTSGSVTGRLLLSAGNAQIKMKGRFHERGGFDDSDSQLPAGAGTFAGGSTTAQPEDVCPGHPSIRRRAVQVDRHPQRIRSLVQYILR